MTLADRSPRILLPLSRAALGVALLAAASACAGAQQNARPAQQDAPAAQRAPAKPVLVVFLTIDQLSSDYLARYGGNLTSGLRRLRDEGALWLRGVHDHAISETAPGHASTMSGRFPVSTGISSNSQGVNTRDAPLVAGNDIGASPFRFRGTTLYDWMKAADPSTRVLSVSRKDRGAILPIGRAKVDVYWFVSDGVFTTSTYYRDTLPSWVRAFNARRVPHSYAGKTWSPLLAADRYAERDSAGIESGGVDYVFPHVMPSDPVQAASLFGQYPWMDSLTLAFALEGARRLELGASPARTDLLAISLSTTDAVGHRYGPDSKEIHDHLLRLDRYLGAFLDSLFAMRDERRVVVALTADHGVAPYPDVRSPWYPNGGAQRVSQGAAWRLVHDRMRAAGIDTAAAAYDDGFRVVDASAFRRAGAEPDSFAAVWVREMRRVNGVLRADLLSDLARADTVTDDIARRWLHMLPLDGPVRAVSTLTPYSYWAGVNYATHGQPHDYDTRVPVLFWGAGIAPGERGSAARVVDMAPTLAAWLGVRPLERLDGRVLPLGAPR
jgi:predicted AlkP superfamily pyrophosphatase or phosphodiesterase